MAGQFQFIHMEIGGAVAAVLKEAKGSLTLQEVVNGLELGGFGSEEGGANPSGVNAALMKLSGVKKAAEGYAHDDGAWPF